MPRQIARCRRESNDQGGDGVAKGGADNDDDEDDPPAFSPDRARPVGERGDMCVQGRVVVRRAMGGVGVCSRKRDIVSDIARDVKIHTAREE
jgi:hypothetical protein